MQCRATGSRAAEPHPLLLAFAVPAGDPGCYVPLSWLQHWADADGSSPIDPIDNSTLLCAHGNLDPAKAQGAHVLRCAVHAALLCGVQEQRRGQGRLQSAPSCAGCATA